MLRNYATVGFRYLLKHKGYAFINMVGLGVSLAACILILLFVEDEFSFDCFHEQADRIVRVTHEQLDENGASQVQRVTIDPPVGPLLKEMFPEVIQAVRLQPAGPMMTYDGQHVASGEFYWTDPTVFEVFTLPLIAGDPRQALAEPFSVVLSAEKARALFGDGDALGQSVQMIDDHLFTVTGVFEDLPANTHLPIDVMASMASMEQLFGPSGWGSPNYATYLLLNEQASAEALTQKLPEFLAQHRDADFARTNRLHLQPLTDIHLQSHFVGELAPNGDARLVYLFSAIALVILLIAGINFTNLSTARSTQRAKEVGMRKSIGASRGALIGQFLGESIMLTFLGLLLAVLLVKMALPAFNAFTGKTLDFQGGGLFRRLALLLGFGLVVGVGAGSYPAFYLSRFRPIAVLKGDLRHGRATFRTALVATQFVIAIALLIATFVVYRQLAFVREQNLGYDQEHLLIVPNIRRIASDFEPFREQLRQHPDVVDVAQSNPVPSQALFGAGEATVISQSSGQAIGATLFNVWVDEHFFPTYGIDVIAGRNLSQEAASGEEAHFLLNETAAHDLGWDVPEEAVGQPLTFEGQRGQVIGVVRDFHLESLHQAIAPMIFYPEPYNFRLVSIRIRAGNDLPNLLAFLEDRWQQYEPEYPLSYSFLDERFDAIYKAEQKLAQLFSAFAALALLITCLGLLGMTAYVVEQRTKEIGIRKVLGASVPGIVRLLSQQVAWIVLGAFVVAVPIAFFAMARWLDGFAYHIDLGMDIFLAAGAAVLLVAMLTVSYHAYRAATVDPVKCLRYE